MANNNTELKGWAKYCKEQNIEFSTKRIFIDGLGGMAHGLFASLLIGCIINTIGMYVPLLKDIVVNPWMSDKLAGENLLIASKTAAYAVQGAAMAAAIAYSMKAPPFVMYSTLAVGFAANALGAQGGPLAVFFVVVIAVFFGKLVSKRTPIDIIVTPFVTIVVGVLFAFLIAPPIGKGAVLLGDLVMKATALQPFWMGILVSALMGIILTSPPGKNICIVSQTTFNYNKFKDLVEILRKKRYDNTVLNILNILNTICNATEERQREAKSIAGEVDTMLVVGGRHSSNTQKLFEICKKECENTYYIQTPVDLDSDMFQCSSYVGITAGASTPKKIIEEVQEHVRIKF